MPNPLVSIIVPIYKVEPYLRRCLDSIVNQTYTNLEIILVDDGSPDGCPQICDEYAAKDKRIIVIHKENGGLSDARNAGLGICKGEYVSFVDSDDWVDEKYIETFCTILIKEGTYDIIAANHFKCNENEKNIGSYSKDKKILTKQNAISNYCKLGIIPICAWNKLYNANFLKDNKLSFKKELLFEDQLWGLQCASKAEKIRLIPQAIYFYDNRQSSIMNSPNISIDKRINSWSKILQESIQILDNSEICLKKRNSFLLHKIEEALATSLYNFKTFKKSYATICKSIHQNPIYYWYKSAIIPKKPLLFLLYIAPATIAQFIFYNHIKKKK